MCNFFVTSNENVLSKFGIQISCVIQGISDIEKVNKEWTQTAEIQN